VDAAQLRAVVDGLLDAARRGAGLPGLRFASEVPQA
jgi:hypothetical protein